MRGIALACGSIYTLYMYIAGRRIHMYIHVQVYIHGRQSDRKTKLSCESKLLEYRGIGTRSEGEWLILTLDQSTYGFITERHGLSLFGCL